jgi:hypothetical protein
LAALRTPVFLGSSQNEVLRAPAHCSFDTFGKKMRESFTGSIKVQ